MAFCSLFVAGSLRLMPQTAPHPVWHSFPCVLPLVALVSLSKTVLAALGKSRTVPAITILRGKKKLRSCSGAVLSSAKWQIKEIMWHCIGAANRRGPPVPYAQPRSLYTVARVPSDGTKCTPLEQRPPEYFYKTTSLFLTSLTVT